MIRSGFSGALCLVLGLASRATAVENGTAPNDLGSGGAQSGGGVDNGASGAGATTSGRSTGSSAAGASSAGAGSLAAGGGGSGSIGANAGAGGAAKGGASGSSSSAGSASGGRSGANAGGSSRRLVCRRLVCRGRGNLHDARSGVLGSAQLFVLHGKHEMHLRDRVRFGWRLQGQRSLHERKILRSRRLLQLIRSRLPKSLRARAAPPS
jgi:hypothetical protein